MTGLDRRSKGIVILLIALPVALLAFVGGHIVHGWNNPDTQCSYASQEPPIPIEVRGESGMRENGGWSVVPFVSRARCSSRRAAPPSWASC